MRGMLSFSPLIEYINTSHVSMVSVFTKILVLLASLFVSSHHKLSEKRWQWGAFELNYNRSVAFLFLTFINSIYAYISWQYAMISMRSCFEFNLFRNEMKMKIDPLKHNAGEPWNVLFLWFQNRIWDCSTYLKTQ